MDNNIHFQIMFSVNANSLNILPSSFTGRIAIIIIVIAAAATAAGLLRPQIVPASGRTVGDHLFLPLGYRNNFILFIYFTIKLHDKDPDNEM